MTQEELQKENELLRVKFETAVRLISEQQAQIKVYIELYQNLVESHSRLIESFEALSRIK